MIFYTPYISYLMPHLIQILSESKKKKRQSQYKCICVTSSSCRCEVETEKLHSWSFVESFDSIIIFYKQLWYICRVTSFFWNLIVIFILFLLLFVHNHRSTTMLTLFVHVKESLLKIEQTGSLTYEFRCIFFLAFNSFNTNVYASEPM